MKKGIYIKKTVALRNRWVFVTQKRTTSPEAPQDAEIESLREDVDDEIAAINKALTTQIITENSSQKEMELAASAWGQHAKNKIGVDFLEKFPLWVEKQGRPAPVFASFINNKFYGDDSSKEINDLVKSLLIGLKIDVSKENYNQEYKKYILMQVGKTLSGLSHDRAITAEIPKILINECSKLYVSAQTKESTSFYGDLLFTIIDNLQSNGDDLYRSSKIQREKIAKITKTSVFYLIENFHPMSSHLIAHFLANSHKPYCLEYLNKLTESSKAISQLSFAQLTQAKKGNPNLLNFIISLRSNLKVIETFKTITAAQQANLEEKEEFIQLIDGNGDTPLHAAARSGIPGITKTLLQSKIDSSIRNKEGETALMIATKFKHTGVIKVINEQADIYNWTITDTNGNSALNLLPLTCDLTVIETVLSHLETTQGEEKIKDIFQNNPKSILISAAESGHLGLLRYIYKFHKKLGIPIDEKTKKSILLAAIKSNADDIVRFSLIKFKLNPNEKIDGISPYSLAIKKGHIETLHILINHVKTFEHQERHLNFENLLAIGIENKLSVDHIQKIIHLIADSVCDLQIDHPNRFISMLLNFPSNPPINIAARFGYDLIIKVLSDNGATIFNTKPSPLEIAAEEGFSHTYELLFKKLLDELYIDAFRKKIQNIDKLIDKNIFLTIDFQQLDTNIELFCEEVLQGIPTRENPLDEIKETIEKFKDKIIKLKKEGLKFNRFISRDLRDLEQLQKSKGFVSYHDAKEFLK